MKSGHILLFLALLISGLMGVISCDDQEAPRSRLIVSRISAASQEAVVGDFVLESDIAILVEDENTGEIFYTLAADQVYVTVENQPRHADGQIVAGGPFGAVILTGYTVDYITENESIETLNAGMHLEVPSGESAIARIVVVTIETKNNPPLSTLRVSLDPPEIRSIAKITLRGYEETSEAAVETVAYFQIHFSNWEDEDDS